MSSKRHAAGQLALGNRTPDSTLTQWLYEELRSAILSGRLLGFAAFDEQQIEQGVKLLGRALAKSPQA